MPLSAEGRFQKPYLTVLFSSYHCGNEALHKIKDHSCCLGALHSDKGPYRSDIQAGNAGTVSVAKALPSEFYAGELSQEMC